MYAIKALKQAIELWRDIVKNNYIEKDQSILSRGYYLRCPLCHQVSQLNPGRLRCRLCPMYSHWGVDTQDKPEYPCKGKDSPFFKWVSNESDTERLLHASKVLTLLETRLKELESD